MPENNAPCTLKTSCPFKSSEKRCQLANNHCSYRKEEAPATDKYVRKERWYEKYYK